ncbi:MAG: dTMP kinase [Novosphingobium sp.]|nr:dTMP kinase [Novosphingobium sp.]
MTRGRFVTFEGGEGVGKSTQSRMLAAALETRGIDVVLTREPGGTPGAEAIRSLLLTTDGAGWNARAEALLFAAARSDHVERLIRPAMERGSWVICDRFLDSSRAYQGGGSGIGEADLLELHRIGSNGLLPDRTILIEVPPDVTAARLARRDGGEADRIGGRDAAYHARVAQAFADLAEAEPARFIRVDGQCDPDETHARILAGLAPLLEQAQ